MGVASTEAIEKFNMALDIVADHKTTEDLAKFLHDNGIKGIGGDCNKCPIANFLVTAVGPDYWVAVTDIAELRDATDRLILESRRLPYVAQEFIETFDNLAESAKPTGCDCAGCKDFVREVPQLWRDLMMADF